MKPNSIAIDWNNINLNEGYERDQNFLDSYNFDTLLMEINCNIPSHKINETEVRKHAIEVLKAKYEEAIEILESNLTNITKHAKK